MRSSFKIRSLPLPPATTNLPEQRRDHNARHLHPISPNLIALKATIDARLEEIKQRHLEEAAALGLTLVDGAKTPRRKRRNTHKEAE